MTSPAFAAERKLLLAGEDLVRRNAAFLDVPEPVRMRSTIAAGPYEHNRGRLLVRAYPEKGYSGIQIWTGQCDVIPQAERVAASIGQIDIFFNWPAEEILLRERPKYQGMVGGYPMYNDRIYISKGRPAAVDPHHLARPPHRRAEAPPGARRRLGAAESPPPDAG